MKVNQAYIGLQVVTNDASDATVYEIVELFRSGSEVMAVLQDIKNSKYTEFQCEVCCLQIPTIEQLTA